MRRDESCLFCRIVGGEIPSDTVYEDEHVVAFRDIQPTAPTHVLVIPKDHIPSFHDLEKGDSEIVASLYQAAITVADRAGISTEGYRVVTNIGSNGGQSVAHLHLHVLGGRPLGSLG